MRLPKRFSQLFAPVLVLFAELGFVMRAVGRRKEASHATR